MPSTGLPVEKIVSGGQSGVDRAALDTALALGIEHGGWCPAGRRAEDGPIDPRYRLRETPSPEYAARTERNVQDSDGTLIVCQGAPRGGTRLTCRLAEQFGRPLLIVDLDADPNPQTVRDWLVARGIGVLNVAGPRASQSPGIAAAAGKFLERVFGPLE